VPFYNTGVRGRCPRAQASRARSTFNAGARERGHAGGWGAGGGGTRGAPHVYKATQLFQVVRKGMRARPAVSHPVAPLSWPGVHAGGCRLSATDAHVVGRELLERVRGRPASVVSLYSHLSAVLEPQWLAGGLWEHNEDLAPQILSGFH